MLLHCTKALLAAVLQYVIGVKLAIRLKVQIQKSLYVALGWAVLGNGYPVLEDRSFQEPLTEHSFLPSACYLEDILKLCCRQHSSPHELTRGQNRHVEKAARRPEAGQLGPFDCDLPSPDSHNSATNP